jgi:hypothetical protein
MNNPSQTLTKAEPWTLDQFAIGCIGGNGECGEPMLTCNGSPERFPRWCDCPKGRAELEAIYGPLPTITYQPGWVFRWSCANGMLFLHFIAGEPHAKGFSAVTGKPRGCTDWMFAVGGDLGLTFPVEPQWLLDKLADMEDHERREWLKIDGTRPFDPHAPALVGDEETGA